MHVAYNNAIFSQKIDPDFKPTLTSHHAVFLSVESRLDSLHHSSLLAVEAKETYCTQSYTDGYWSENTCDAEEVHQSCASTLTCTL